MNNLWSLLAGILHAGDVEFAGDEEAYVVSADDVVTKCTTNLGVVQDALMEALITSVNITRGTRSCCKRGRLLNRWTTWGGVLGVRGWGVGSSMLLLFCSRSQTHLYSTSFTASSSTLSLDCVMRCL